MMNNGQNKKYLDHSIVKEKDVNGFDGFFWVLFSDRRYKRNKERWDFIFGAIFLFILLVLPTYAIYYYFPLKLTVVPIFFGPLAACVFIPIMFSNMSLVCSFIYVLVSAYCYFQHWNLGITLFTFHLEHYIFTAFLITSILGLVRRGWNSYVWWQLDRITLRYCRKNNIAISEGA